MTNDWKPTSLGEILTLERRPVKLEPDKDYAEIGIYSYGRGIFHKQPRTGFEVGEKDLFLIKKGDFIFQITFAWEGAFGLASESEDGMYGSVRFPTFRVNEDVCYPPFLLNYFKIDDGRNQLIKISPGSAGRNRVLNTKRLPEILIPLPPLDEQRRIVERVEALAAGIAKAQSLREEASEEINFLSLSAYHQAFQVKDDWQILRVGDFCDNPQYGYTESAKYDPVGPKFLRITDIQDSKVDWDSVPYCECPQPEKYLLKSKDIVFARTGATTGKSFLIQECPESVFASYLIRLRVLHTVTPEHLYAFFQSPDYWSQITDEKKGTGQPNVNGQNS